MQTTFFKRPWKKNNTLVTNLDSNNDGGNGEITLNYLNDKTEQNWEAQGLSP